MATYVVGDVHGCYRTFRQLLKEMSFRDGRDALWFVGDLVNKGAGSLDMLRWVADRENHVVTVLGNHDLHLLSCYHGLREMKESDTLAPVLEAQEADSLIAWLATRPFLHASESCVLVHAGILPGWSLGETEKLAAAASRTLGARPLDLLRPLNRDSDADRADLRFVDEEEPHWIARVLTLIRTCRSPFRPELAYTGPPEAAPDGARPWYEFPLVADSERLFLFGHWARHGFVHAERYICLDSGCVYGGALTAVRLEDRQIFQVPNSE